MHSFKQFQVKVLSAFAATALVVMGLSLATWFLAQDATVNAREVVRSHQILNLIAQIRSDTWQIELSTQTYRITGDAINLATRDEAIVRREAALADLREQTIHDSAQQGSWRQLRDVLDQRLAIARRIESLRKEQGAEAANAFAANARLGDRRGRALHLLNAMEGEEARILDIRHALQSRTRGFILGFGALVTLLLFVLLSATYVLLRRQMQEAVHGQRRIVEQNALLEQRVSERTAQMRESQAHLQSVISNVPALIAYVDSRRRYVYVNQQYRQRFAPDRGDITGHTVREILGERRYAMAAPLIDRVLLGEPQSYDWEPFQGVWLGITYVPKRDERNDVTGYYVLGTDITERRRASEKIEILNAELEGRVGELERVSRALRTLSAGNQAMLRAREEQSLLGDMCEAIVQAGGYDMAAVWYCEHDEAKSLRARAQAGYAPGLAALEALPATWADDPHGQGAAAVAIRTGRHCTVRNILDAPGYAPWHAQLDLDRATSSIACPLRIDGEIIGALAIYDAAPGTFGGDEVALLEESANDLAFGIRVLRMRTEQRRTEEAMYQLTHHDALTGLPNEVQFTILLAEAIARAADFAVLQVDVERLREVNSALGFEQGDRMLREFSRRLQSAAPAGAAVARLRGDEFAVLLWGGREAAMAMARSLEAAFASPLVTAELSLQLSAKTGIALYPQHGTSPHDLYRHMNIAVDHAKKLGASQVVFDPAWSRDQRLRLSLAAELRGAIKSNELRLFVQPKIDISSGQVVGAEGLVRWEHPSRGMVNPAEFVALAEQTGLIRPLTDWVIEEAVRLLQVWALKGCRLPIAVNLSVHSLRDDALPDDLAALLQRNGIAPHLLELEITESSLMDDAEKAVRLLNALHGFGIPLHIDDFGTGYSSLSYLQRLPVTCVKIDQSFVRQMDVSEDAAVIVKSTIDLLHDLGRKAVAEGIETRAIWDQVAALGCDVAQGYFIARPMPGETFPTWVADFRSPLTSVPPCAASDMNCHEGAEAIPP